MVNNDIADIKDVLEKGQLFVFDFDGVLVDSVEVKTRGFAALYKPYGDSVVDRVIAHHLSNGGMSRYDKFIHYHRMFLGENIDTNSVISLSEKFSELVMEKVIMAPEILGSTKFLKSYCTRKNCVINSATPQLEIQEIVKKRGMDKFFSFVLGSPSSKTDNLDYLIKDGGYKPSNVIFFGDSVSDLIAAENLSVIFLGVGNDILNHLNKMDKSYLHIKDFSDIIPGTG